MITARSLPPQSWSRALDDLTVARRGAHVALVIDWESAGEEVEAHDVLLESMSYDPHDDAIEIVARRPSPSRPAILRHVVESPRAVEVDSPAGIVPRELRMQGADGIWTSVSLTLQPALSG
jgi:hypothetical protein